MALSEFHMNQKLQALKVLVLEADLGNYFGSDDASSIPPLTLETCIVEPIYIL